MNNVSLHHRVLKLLINGRQNPCTGYAKVTQRRKNQRARVVFHGKVANNINSEKIQAILLLLIASFRKTKYTNAVNGCNQFIRTYDV
mmetsp:Transcript_47922/g.83943  ORF Transcript_47922/g.83943 Transcript_47922/m.83943 type:complete len:87 (+) Transcript_47922:1318-1578(+)